MAYSEEERILYNQIRLMASQNEAIDEDEFIQKFSEAGINNPQITLQKAIKEGVCLASARNIWRQGGSSEEGLNNAKTLLGEPLPPYFEGLLMREYSTIQDQETIQDNDRQNEELQNNPALNETVQTVSVNPFQSIIKGEIPLHRNSLFSLTPSSEWWIYVDETGNTFGENLYSAERQDEGRIVGVFFGNKGAVPRLPADWHATNQSNGEIRMVANRLLRTENCGILGISLKQTSIIHCNQWLPGVEMLFEIALRLLPINGPTRLFLRVEQRNLNPDDSRFLRLICEAALKRFARFDPKKAELVTINARVLEKGSDLHLAYADTVAMTWGGSSAAQILKNTQWEGTCLLETNIEPLLAALSEAPTPEMWKELISSPESWMEKSMVTTILNKMGEAVRENADLWQAFMNVALKELESKRINLKKVGHQIDWLKRFCPAKENILPSLELCWRTVQLANSNHHGGVLNNSEEIEEFNRLIEKVLPEDARLACFAALHLSVTFTNAFKFEDSRKILKRWANIDPMAVGRNYHGRLESSLGQIEAFEGNNPKALEHFRQAIEIFSSLNDKLEAFREIKQTRAYLLTTLMDCAACDETYRQELLEEARLYFLVPLNKLAKQLAVSNAPHIKYQHALFLRLLVQDPSMDFQEACQEYVNLRSEWKTDVGHPWEMIEFYRGMLLDDPDERLECFRNAYELVRGEAGVLRVIGAVILGSILLHDPSVQDEYESLLAALSEEFPHETERLAILKSQPTERLLPLDLAERVLPFNFR